ncbi:MAG: MG2 domain-containing protein, partial [Bacteroidales bacterium]
MKFARLLLIPIILLSFISCVNRQKPEIKLPLRKKVDFSEINVPVDRGFSEYIEGYTSGIISVSSPIEVRFTPEFAAKAVKKLPPALFLFEPAVKGKAEWKDDLTVIFKPNKTLDPGKVYTCNVNLYKLEDVKEQFRVFSVKIGTIVKDFVVTTDILESNDDGSRYSLHGELAASDYISSNEVESYLEAKLGRKKQTIIWDHSDRNIHKFTVTGLARADKPQRAEIDWDGTPSDVKQKGRISINIPPTGEFSVIDVLVRRGGSKSIDIVFSDPLDATQEIEGLVWFSQTKEITTSINANILTLHFVTEPEGVAELNVEPSIKNKSGSQPGSAFSKKIDFSPVLPAVELTGEGVIIPASKNLILPFRTANLKSVDLKIIKIFENNLPHFLQENDLNAGYTVKRFGRPIYSGKVDLVSPSGSTPGTWDLHTVDLSDYIDVEPGILYKIELSMKPSYSLYPCTGTEDQSKYEEYLKLSEEKSKEFWDDPEVYYEDGDDFLYYSYGFSWKDRNDPCKPAYYSPDRKASRNIIASNFGIIAKRSPDNSLVVEVNDLLNALPLSEVTITAFDYQLQEIASGNTNQDGSVRIACDRKPFLLIARKDKDRNYLKITEGSSLSMSSFDVSGVKPENGIKAFIYCERDVWRPGDSIYLSVFIKDMKNKVPAGHPVQFELINPLEQRVDYQVKKPDTRNLMIFRTSTSPDAVTGNYKANLRIGGALFTKRIRVESIKPNRLKIDLTFPGDKLEAGSIPANGSLNVKWLNGAVAGNLRSTVEYLFKASKTEFPKFPGYDFDDPANQFYAETVKIFDGSVDENGNAAVVFNPGKELKAPGMLNAVFTARVSEKGGDESITQTVLRYAPYTVFTGINFPGLRGKDRMLFTDRDNEVKLVTVSPEGKRVNSEVEISIYRIAYRWWWEADQENLAGFISNDVYKPVTTGKVRTVNGEGSFT